MRFDTASLSFTLIQLQQTRVNLVKAGEAALTAAGEQLLREVKKTIGLRDHSLTQLASMDHPYARRHGKIRIHTSTPWQVHRKPIGGLSGAALTKKSSKISGHRMQTDNLYNSTTGRFMRLASGPAYEVAFDTSKAPEAIFVTAGTRKMLPRDPLWKTATDPAVTKALMVAIVRQLGKVMRSKVGVRFEGTTPSSTTQSGGRVAVR